MTSVVQRLRRAGGRVVRELALYPRVLRPRRGRRLACLPSSGREQSGLQRAYLVAEQLNDQGWDCIVIPKHLNARQRQRLLGTFRPDFVLVQKCRHPLNRAAHLAQWPVILDVDDADFLDPALAAPMAQVARQARGVICGSRFIQDWARAHNPNTEVIWTGSPLTAGPWPAQETRARIVTWAQSNPLAAEDEFAFVEKVILRAHSQTAPFTFRLYGWRWETDHPRLARLRAAGVALELIAPMPYGAFLLSLREVAVGLSAIVDSGFSRGKSFGKVLGYLDAKTPVICSDAADHALFFDPETGVVSNDEDVWVTALVKLLDDPAARSHMAEAAYQSYCAHLDIRAASRKVARFLDTCGPDPNA